MSLQGGTLSSKMLNPGRKEDNPFTFDKFDAGGAAEVPFPLDEPAKKVRVASGQRLALLSFAIASVVGGKKSSRCCPQKQTARSVCAF